VIWATVEPVAGGSFPLLTALILVPGLGALAVLCISRQRVEVVRSVGMAISVFTAGLAGYLVWDFEVGNPEYQFVEDHRWIESIGVRYILGIDGISLFMVALTALLFPLSLLASTKIDVDVKAYTAFMLLLEASVIGVFVSLDLILFFVFWEAVLVPMYFIIAGWGHERRVYASIKFFLYTMAGSMLMLVATIGIAYLHARSVAPPGASAFDYATFDVRVLQDWDGLATNTGRWLFAAFALSFAIKVPVFPFHTWLPDAHVEAPTAGSVILAGVMLKMGTYGFLRFGFTLFPEASVWFRPLFLTLATIGILYGAIVATVQRDLKKLIAYSSVAHLGFVVLGAFALTSIGIQGGVFTMISHGLTTGALFLLVGMLYDRRHTRLIADFGGLWKSAPRLGGFFLVAMFASVGLPGMSGFVGEYLALTGTFIVERPYAIVSAVGVILAAVYLLYAFQRTFTGEPEGDNRTIADLDVREMAAVLPLLGLAVVLGVYPKPVLDRVEPSARAIVEHVESRTDHRDPDLADDIEGVPLPEEEHGEEHEGEAEHEEEASEEEGSGEEGLAPFAPSTAVAEVVR
jgi:NADH-quinone oxidoreductase subunit M